MERVTYLNLPNCQRLTNGAIEVIVATDIGPRILRYGLVNEDNWLGEYPDASRTTPWGEWKPWGGHRLWVAPEALPRSYAPDNYPVHFQILNELSIRLVGEVEPQTGVQKEMLVTLDESGSGLQVLNRITNRSCWTIELAAWALTIMKGGGVAIVPQEPFHPFPEVLAPVRPLALWSYTDLSDPRFELGPKYLRLRSDPARAESQKIGIGNTRGWCAYHHEKSLFVKRFKYEAGATYADFGSNNEIYTAGSFIELETLSPLRRLEPDASVEHLERWDLLKGVSGDDQSISQAIEKLV